MALDYRRGFKRLFFALAIPWAFVNLVLAVSLVWFAKDNHGVWHETDLWSAAEASSVAVIPPSIAYFALFVVGRWIARGFKSEST